MLEGYPPLLINYIEILKHRMQAVLVILNKCSNKNKYSPTGGGVTFEKNMDYRFNFSTSNVYMRL